MLRFNTKQDCSMMLNRSDFNTSYVTVQPARCLGFRTMRKISIHLMLRFNGSRGCLHQSQLHISIHLMLRFNNKNLKIEKANKKFQYILCCGSTAAIEIRKTAEKNFNTSYVAVQLLKF